MLFISNLLGNVYVYIDVLCYSLKAGYQNLQNFNCAR